MKNHLYASKSALQAGRVAHIGEKNLQFGGRFWRDLSASADQTPNFVALRQERLGEAAAQESTGTGDRDSHGLLLIRMWLEVFSAKPHYCRYGWD